MKGKISLIKIQVLLILFSLALITHLPNSFAFWPPFQNVEVSVEYEEYNHSVSKVQAKVYDAVRDRWQITRFKLPNGASRLVISELSTEDGIVAFKLGVWSEANDTYEMWYVYWAVYDPVKGKWREERKRFKNSSTPRRNTESWNIYIRNKDGVVVLWAGYFSDFLKKWIRREVYCSTYDPALGNWETFRDFSKDDLHLISNENAIVTYLKNGVEYKKGYSADLGQWYTPPEEPVAQFYVIPASEDTPSFNWWLLDQSLGATNWEWSFSDGGFSSERSLYHWFDCGTHEIIQEVIGPNGTDSKTINITVGCLNAFGFERIDNFNGELVRYGVSVEGLLSNPENFDFMTLTSPNGITLIDSRENDYILNGFIIKPGMPIDAFISEGENHYVLYANLGQNQPAFGEYTVSILNSDNTIELYTVEAEESDLSTETPTITFPEYQWQAMINTTPTFSWNSFVSSQKGPEETLDYMVEVIGPPEYSPSGPADEVIWWAFLPEGTTSATYNFDGNAFLPALFPGNYVFMLFANEKRGMNPTMKRTSARYVDFKVGGIVSGTVTCGGCGEGRILVGAWDGPNLYSANLLNYTHIETPGSYILGGLPYDTSMYVYAWWDNEQQWNTLPTSCDYLGIYEGNPITLTAASPIQTNVDFELTDIDVPCDPSLPGTVDDILAVGSWGKLDGTPVPTTFTFDVKFTNTSPCRTVLGVHFDMLEFAKASDLGIGDIDTTEEFLNGVPIAVDSMSSNINAIIGWFTTIDANGEGIEFEVESPLMPIDLGNFSPCEDKIIQIVIRGTPYLVDGYVGGIVTVD